jgi:hypothetical protein
MSIPRESGPLWLLWPFNVSQSREKTTMLKISKISLMAHVFESLAGKSGHPIGGDSDASCSPRHSHAILEGSHGFLTEGMSSLTLAEHEQVIIR